jgi:hypothetical protein
MELAQRARCVMRTWRTTSENYGDSTERLSLGIGRLLAGGKSKDKAKGLRGKS